MTQAKDTPLAVRRRLAKAKRLVKEGKVAIGNAAAATPGAVVVKSYVRHKARTLPEGERGVLVLQWSRPGVGFGEVTLFARDGRLVADTECMSDAFVLDVIGQALREREEVG